MNVRKHARQHAEQSRRRAMLRYLIDDDTTGLWVAKRAQQARSRELLRTGQCSQESMLLIAPALVREAKITRRFNAY